MIRPIGVGGRKGSILPTEKTVEFLALCKKLHGFLQGQLYRQRTRQTTAVSLETTTGGEYYTKKFLAPGLILVATPSRKDSRITSLRIFFDPSRFNQWSESIGPAKLVFLNPYDLEISRNAKEGQWYLALNDQKLNMDLGRKDAYEVAAVEIHDTHAGCVDAVRIR